MVYTVINLKDRAAGKYKADSPEHAARIEFERVSVNGVTRSVRTIVYDEWAVKCYGSFVTTVDPTPPPCEDDGDHKWIVDSMPGDCVKLECIRCGKHRWDWLEGDVPMHSYKKQQEASK